MIREKEYFKSAKTRSQIAKPALQTEIDLLSSEGKQDWLNEFYEGMEQ
ncbi:hypothetical protein M5X11_34210 [Paenibacillus alginolyticus]|nr:hypothetical protein [Paenibacillus alginolyticus]MCY9669908.1 hypothetical protein [Paenibacillus alginolyticus]